MRSAVSVVLDVMVGMAIKARLIGIFLLLAVLFLLWADYHVVPAGQ